MMFAGDRMSAVVNQIRFWVGQNCGRKIGYWVQSVFLWTVRTLMGNNAKLSWWKHHKPWLLSSGRHSSMAYNHSLYGTIVSYTVLFNWGFAEYMQWLCNALAVFGPIPWGHSGPLCHALSLSSWTSMHRRRATVQWRHLVNWREAARCGEWAQHFSNASCLVESAI